MIFEELSQGIIDSRPKHALATRVHGWVEDALALAKEGTHFGFVYKGYAQLRCVFGEFLLSRGMYFAVPAECTILGGQGIAITRIAYRGLFQIGGPVEDQGRLRYIDGCTDTLLVAPVMLGDPCLNLLHLPPWTRQTRHTHPSLRAGLIIHGEGFCVCPKRRIPIASGQVFVIEAGEAHSFHTDESELLVLAYHPDSDFGPTHECHPMVNRTIFTKHDSA